MSGIYIPGMEMPEVGHVNMEVVKADDMYFIGPCGKDKWFQLISVPDHSELIEREKLYEQAAKWEAVALDQVLKFSPEEDAHKWRWWSAVLTERSAFKFDVADAPTIIPADKEEIQ